MLNCIAFRSQDVVAQIFGYTKSWQHLVNSLFAEIILYRATLEPTQVWGTFAEVFPWGYLYM